MRSSTSIPWRGIGVGIIFTILLSLWAQYSTNIGDGGIADDFAAIGAIFFLFILAGALNPLFKLCRFPLTLSSRDLITVYIMMITASSVITMGLINQLPILVSPFYYADLHKGYATDIQPHINPLLVPQGKEVIIRFFEGLKPGESIPWLAWFKPLSVWMIFFLTLFFVMLCMLVIVRKQWMERERITFPLVQVPLAMLEGESSSSKFTPFFRNKLMWMGFALPFILLSITALHEYFPFIPQVPLSKGIRAFRGTAWMAIGINFAVFGFLYFVNLDVSFSIWFFFLLSFAVDGFFCMMGIGGVPENISQYGCEGKPIFAHLGIGALAAFVFYGLWTARDHLKEVFKKAVGKNESLNDRDEILSYKTAVWGIIFGSIILLIWLNRLAGLKIGVAVSFLFLALLIFFGLTKIVSQAGIPNAVATSIAPAETVSSLGTHVIGQQGMVGIAQQFIWAADIRTNPMTHSAHSLKLAGESGQNRRWMFWVLMGAFIIATVAAFFTLLKLSYSKGGINLNSWYFGSYRRSGANEPYWYVLDRMREHAGPNAFGWQMKVLGAGLMLFLSFMHHRFLWWPLNPIGLMLGPIWMMKSQWFSVFLAWLIKATILRYGGPGSYRRLRPFFLGLILGQFTATNVWLIVKICSNIGK